MSTRICSKCGFAKPFDAFYKKKTGRDGLCAMCKACVVENTSKYARSNPDKNKIYQARYCAKYPEKRKALEKKGKAERADIIKKQRKAYREKSHALIKSQQANLRKSLSPCYVKGQLCKNYGLNAAAIKANPDLVLSYTGQLKLKRLIKSKSQTPKPPIS